MNKQKMLDHIVKNSFWRRIYYRLKHNHFDKGIMLDSEGRLVSCEIKQEKGNVGNKVVIKKRTNLINTCIEFHGNNNLVYIDENGQITRNHLLVYDNNNTLQIGKHFNSGHDTTIAILEGGNITIGDDCLFSYNVEVRNSDSHSLIDDKGNRINNAKDVVIGNHVWMAQRAIVLKGATINDGCVVAANALVTNHCFEPASLLAGLPARVMKSGIDWDIGRL